MVHGLSDNFDAFIIDDEGKMIDNMERLWFTFNYTPSWMRVERWEEVYFMPDAMFCVGMNNPNDSWNNSGNYIYVLERDSSGQERHVYYMVEKFNAEDIISSSPLLLWPTMEHIKVIVNSLTDEERQGDFVEYAEDNRRILIKNLSEMRV